VAAEEEEEEGDEEAMLLLDEGVEETEGGSMHPRAEELLRAHLAKADHAGYQRMQVGACVVAEIGLGCWVALGWVLMWGLGGTPQSVNL
jgi:hypothetical protein